MDTEALWQAIAAYGNARWRDVKYEQDAADHLSEIKAILSEADAERQELLATNEKLVDEVADLKSAVQIYLGVVQERNRLESENAELKSKLTDKASLLRGCYAADHKQKQRIEELTAELERIKANPVHQFRKSRCADWFDGLPDHTDGGGPYETRTLYALGGKT